MPNGSYSGGELATIKNCYIIIPNFGKVEFHSLPDVGDSKSAAYNDEPIIGRATPLTTFSHSEKRAISLTLHLFIRKKSDAYTNLRIKRAIESCLYPRDTSVGANAPFVPPPPCRIRFGSFFGDKDLCCILKSCNVKPTNDVPYDEDTMCPYKMDIDTSWEVVYRNSQLPGQGRIIREGR